MLSGDFKWQTYQGKYPKCKKKEKRHTEKNTCLQQKSLRKKAGCSSTPQLGTQALETQALRMRKNDCESDMNIDFGVTHKFQQAETLTNMECVNNELDCYI